MRRLISVAAVLISLGVAIPSASATQLSASSSDAAAISGASGSGVIASSGTAGTLLHYDAATEAWTSISTSGSVTAANGIISSTQPDLAVQPDLSFSSFVPNWTCAVISSALIGICGNLGGPLSYPLPTDAIKLTQDMADFGSEEMKKLVEGAESEVSKALHPEYDETSDGDGVEDTIIDMGDGVTYTIMDVLEWG